MPLTGNRLLVAMEIGFILYACVVRISNRLILRIRFSNVIFKLYLSIRAY